MFNHFNLAPVPLRLLPVPEWFPKDRSAVVEVTTG
ncbi:hypothetical protein NIASO_10855 [Niabella soli DSM 19437]|uniref:Uncharacterized protein n=1 Tax=Niabella soli DSM 19437 TaxID=929713 RepID=W0F814_9BACT|nr:hypothetical protein NIASO_10855 [Niabella soli DSM 19437]